MKGTLLTVLFYVLLSNNALANSTRDIDVIAVEYPPFSTMTDASGGLSFKLLNKQTLGQGYQWRPYFVPPKRAYKMIESGDWCASFYPANISNQYIQYQLSDESISIGLVRIKQQQTFTWSSLDELNGHTVAILSTDANSPFAQTIDQAGLVKAEVQTVQAGVQMVLLGRVDFAMLDNVSFAALESGSKSRLQFSKASLLTTKLNIYVNPECHITLPSLKELSRKVH